VNELIAGGDESQIRAVPSASPGADLLIEDVYATGPICQEQDRNRLFAPAEVIYTLLYSVLEQHHVIFGEIGQDAARLFLVGEQVDDDQIGS
jgi:hypothetical protein